MTQTAIAKAGGIGPLLALLQSRSGAAQAQSMSALAQLAKDNRENQDAIARQGGIKPLVLLLETSHDRNVQAYAAFALNVITRFNSPNQTSVVDCGGISQLASAMKTSQFPEVKAEVAGALWSLSEDMAIKGWIAAAATIHPLVNLLGVGETRARDFAFAALTSLGLDNEGNQVQLTQLLIDLLINGSVEAQQRAVTALTALREENPTAHHVIADAGDPEKLVELLKNGIAESKDYALWSLSLSIARDNQGRVAEAGGVQPLIDHLSDQRVLTREEAAAALHKLARDNDETRSLITRAGGVAPLVVQLGSSGEGSSEKVRQNAAAALAELAVDTSARDELVSGGGVPHIVRVLENETSKTKTYVATAVARLAKDHEATALAMAKAGAIVPLVALLDGNEGPEAQEEAAGALFALADHEYNRQAITKCDGIGWLVMLLGCDNPRAREHAEGVLVRLSIENANRVLIIKKLVDMLSESTGDGSAGNNAQEQAAAALANLARESEDNRKSIVEANGIPPLLALLDSTSSKAKENAVGAITQLCRRSHTNQAQIAKAGGVPKLVGVLLSFSQVTMKADAAAVQLCTLAASAVKEMAKGNRKNQDIITNGGGIGPLVAMLGSTSPAMQANAAGALANLARGHQDNSSSIAKTGAIAPLCALVREGDSAEARDQSASALWALATDNAANKDTIAKLGGIDPLVALLVSGTSEKSLNCCAGALSALASRHSDNRQLIVKKLVGLLGSSNTRTPDRAVRVLTTVSSFTRDSPANQIAIAKAGGIPPLITWLGSNSTGCVTEAAHAVMCLATDNATTQTLIARANAIPPLIQLVKRTTVATAQNYAARAIFYLASVMENQQMITDSQAIKPLVAMLSSEHKDAPELAAIILVRLARPNPEVSTMIADKNGILPLVALVRHGTPGAQQQAANALGELALVSRSRDQIANADGIEPLIKLLSSPTPGSAEVAARALSHLAREDEIIIKQEDESSLAARLRRKQKGSAGAKADGQPATATPQAPAAQQAAAPDSAPPRTRRMSLHGSPRDTRQFREGLQAQGLEPAAAGAIPKAGTSLMGAPEGGGTDSRRKSLRGEPADARHVGDRLDTMGIVGSAERRMAINDAGGVARLIFMVDPENKPKAGGKFGARTSKEGGMDRASRASKPEGGMDSAPAPSAPKAPGDGPKGASRASGDERSINSLGLPDDSGSRIGVQEQAAAALADFAYNNADMQDAIIDHGGVAPLLALIRIGTQVAQEHAARCAWHLCAIIGNQNNLVECGTVVDLVHLIKVGSPKAQEFAAAGLSDLARGSIVEKQAMLASKLMASRMAPSPAGASDRGSSPGGRREKAAKGKSKGKGRDASPVASARDSTPEARKSTGKATPRSRRGSMSKGSTDPLSMAAARLTDTATPQLRRPPQAPTPHSPSLVAAPAVASPRGTPPVSARGTPPVSARGTPPVSARGTPPVSARGTPPVSARGTPPVSARGTSRTPRSVRSPRAAPLSHSPREGPTAAAPSATSPFLVAMAPAAAPPLVVAMAPAPSLAFPAAFAPAASPAAAFAPAASPTVQSTGPLFPEGEPPLSGRRRGGIQMEDARDLDTDRLVAIAEAGGIKPLVQLLDPSLSTAQARENAAGALWHLALNRENQVNIAKVNGIAPLVTVLDDGTAEAHQHAADALARLATNNADNQAHIAKHCVNLLGNLKVGAQRRAAKALKDLADDNPGSPVVIVNAGAISPLVHLLSTGAPEVKEQVAGTLSSVSLKSQATQLAIATGLVALVGAGYAESQEHVTQLLLILTQDNDNRSAIARAGAIPRLVAQMRGALYTSTKAQDLAAAVLAHLSGDSDENVAAIAAASGIRPLVMMLTADSSTAQTHAAATLSDIARVAVKNKTTIISEGGIPPLVALLGKDNHYKAKAEAAGALIGLTAGMPDTQKAVADAGAIKLLVALLNEDHDYARKKAAGAIAALASGLSDIQDAVEKFKGVSKLVGLLGGSNPDDVRAEASMALATLAWDNRKIQDKVTATNGIGPLVDLLQEGVQEKAKEEAAGAIWSLAANHYENQVAIANADGIASLVRLLGSGSVRAQEYAAEALASLALDNVKNEVVIAELVVDLLGSKDKQPSAKAARAISRLARSHYANQASIANAGGVALLVSLLDADEGRMAMHTPEHSDAEDEANEHGGRRKSSESEAVSTPTQARDGHKQYPPSGGHAGTTDYVPPPIIQREMASAVWSMTFQNPDNQKAIADAGGIPPLIALLGGNPEVHKDAAGALWSLAASSENQVIIASEGGIVPFVELVKNGSFGAQETSAGALFALAEERDNRVSIAAAGGIPALVALFDGGTEGSIEQAAGALQTLALQNKPNQLAISNDLVAMLKSGSREAQENVTTLLRSLATEPENRGAIAKAGAVPELVRQLETGSEKAMGMAASGLALIALKSAEHRSTVTNELVKLLGCENEAVRQRASEALRDMADGDTGPAKKSISSSTGGSAQLVKLLRDGLRDGRVEAQEYALWSLSSISDPTSREGIVHEGGIKPLIQALRSGKLSATAQEHAAAVLGGLAPLGENAWAIKQAGGIDPLVLLLSNGNADAKEHAAAALAQLARRAEASREIAEAGAVSAFVQWLADPTLGPPEVAARALTVIAHDDPDTQTQIVEEGAIEPLVAMVGVLNPPRPPSPTLAPTSATPEGAAMAPSASTASPSRRKSRVGSSFREQRETPDVVVDKTVAAPERSATSLAPSAAAVSSTLASGTSLAPDADSTVQVASAPTAASAPFMAANGLEATAPPAVSPSSRRPPPATGVEGIIGGVMGGIMGGGSPTSVRPPIMGGSPPGQRPGSPNFMRPGSPTGFRQGSTGSMRPPTGSPAGMRPPTKPPVSEAATARALLAQKLQLSNTAAGTLATLAKNNVINQICIADEGGVAPLVHLIKSEHTATFEQATNALWHLAANEDNQTQIAQAGGLAPLVGLLTTENATTQQYATAALESLARDHADNQVALAKAGAIAPLVDLLGCPSTETQRHAKGALLYVASENEASRNAVVQRLVGVLDARSAAAQMKACEALAVLAARSSDTRRTITAANAIAPLVRLLGDGRRVRADTPQERAAAVLADLAKFGENKSAIVEAGGVSPLVAMLESASPEATCHAAASLNQLAALGSNRPIIARANAIPPLVDLLAHGSEEAHRYATGALWHLASAADNKVAMVNAGVIPPLVKVLVSTVAEARENAAAVISTLARTQGGNKKAIHLAGGIPPLIALLSDPSTSTQRHAACALWGLSDGKDGVYDKEIVEYGGVKPFIELLHRDNQETRGFAAACLMCLCAGANQETRSAIIEAGGAEPLQLLAHGPAAWLSQQAEKMLKLLGIPMLDPEAVEMLRPLSPKDGSPGGLPAPSYLRGGNDKGSVSDRNSPGYRSHRALMSSPQVSARAPMSARHKYHFFSFQVQHITGFLGHS